MSIPQSDEARRQVRERAQALVQRLQTDAAFKQQVEADPKATLTSAGIPENAVEDFVREAGIAGEVQGYSICDFSCEWTCFITGFR